MNKEDLLSVVCQSQNDYDIVNSAYEYIDKLEKICKRIDNTNKWVLDLKKNLNSSLLGHKAYRDYIIDILNEISKQLKGE